MGENRNIVLLKDLNLTSRFLFDEVMEDTVAHQEALSIIFGRDISLLGRAESEKEFRVSPAIRSVRMDVFSKDDMGTIYNSEMQSQWRNDLAKRSRYYQGIMDTSLLEAGVASYNLLSDTYIIVITTFDLFGLKKYRYVFRSSCEGIPDLLLNDGAVRIFLNTRGENDEDESPELVNFLHYLEKTTDEQAEQSGSSRIRKIHEKVKRVRHSEEVGVRYMQAWEEKYYAREEGIEEGIKEGIKEGKRQVLHKLAEKGLSAAQIGELLEMPEEQVAELMKDSKAENQK